MMLVRCSLAPSPIHGLGLFLDEEVRKGAMVWRFSSLTEQLYPARVQYGSPFDEFLDRYAYCKAHGVRILCGDLAKFMNHSETPTLTGELADYAVRDLVAGDELTCDYRVFDRDWKLKLGLT